MNKKIIIAFCAAGLVMLALLAAMLMGRGERAPQTAVPTTTGADQQIQSAAAQTEAAEQQTAADGSTGFTVAAGVGDKEDWGPTEIPGGSSQATEEAPNRETASEVDTSPARQDGTAPDDGMPDVLLTYEKFMQLSPAEQDAYFLQFADPRDYAAWLRAAKQEYENDQTSIIITGPIDLGTLPADGT